MERAFIPELVSRYSFNQLELTAIGCTRQSEAHRKGLWGILTNNKDRIVEFDVGLDGRIPQPGYIIARRMSCWPDGSTAGESAR